jgi:hypothetical protein
MDNVYFIRRGRMPSANNKWALIIAATAAAVTFIIFGLALSSRHSEKRATATENVHVRSKTVAATSILHEVRKPRETANVTTNVSESISLQEPETREAPLSVSECK